MSSSAFIFLLLLCLYVHACNARHLRGSPKHSIKVAEKVMPGKPSITPATVVQSKSPAAEVQSQPKIPVKVQVEADDPSAMPAAGAVSAAGKPKERQTSTRAESVEGTRGVASGAVPIESFVTVTWRVPREKHAEHPGFNLDYSPPKTHPPSHN